MGNSDFSRRDLLASGAAVAALTLMGDVAGAARGRPNILWLVSEDNNPFIGAYGDRLARTPTIDALAASGVRFQNVFSTAPVCAPSRFAIITGMHPESCAPAHHMRAVARLPAFLQGFPSYLRKAGYYCTNNAKTDYNADLSLEAMWDESSNRAHWRNRPKGAPFFAVFNFGTTHESRLFALTEGAVRPEDVRVPGYLPDTPEVRKDIASYYNLMEKLDGEIAVRLAELEEDGVAEDTIVFYYSDNGGALPRSKRYCYDEGLRCALIVRTPEKWAHLASAPAGSVVTEPVMLTDLAPTVLALAGLTPPSHMHGTSLIGRARRQQRYAFGMRNRMDERYDMVRTVRDERYRYIRNYLPHRIYGQHIAYAWQANGYRAWETAYRAGRLNEQQERFWREKPAEEFYDLVADPDQLNNLIDAPEHRQRIDAMRTALDEHMLAVNDNGFIPEGSPLEGYENSRVPNAYPLRRIMALAATTIQRKPENVPRLIAALRDDNDVIRYWAAQGLLMLRKLANDALEPLRRCLNEDPSPSVRIVAAEALTWIAEPEPSVRYLSKVLDSEKHQRIRLQALDALTWIGPAASAALDSIERAIVDPRADEYVRTAARYLSLVLKGTYTPESPVYQGPGARRS